MRTINLKENIKKQFEKMGSGYLTEREIKTIGVTIPKRQDRNSKVYKPYSL